VSDTFQFERAVRFRSNATACGIFAANALSLSDRELLLRMRQSWLARARHADFIDGQPPRPPAGSKALAVPRI
jgi:hypothetical protein